MYKIQVSRKNTASKRYDHITSKRVLASLNLYRSPLKNSKLNLLFSCLFLCLFAELSRGIPCTACIPGFEASDESSHRPETRLH